jgi:hypothetical protein
MINGQLIDLALKTVVQLIKLVSDFVGESGMSDV